MLSYKEIKNLRRHDPFIIGNNQSHFVTGYFPADKLKQILPDQMSLPSDEIMAQEYPTVNKIDGMHPCLLLFSRCYNVHDVITNKELRPYLELLFYFPVEYSHKGETRLCSYLPVLYLDFLLGTLGGLFLGLRKQFHPKLKYSETEEARSFNLNNVINADFQKNSGERKGELDPFFTQLFNQPTATVSYFNRTVFYSASVYPQKVVDTSAVYEWNYKGAVIKNNESTFADYCEYTFSTSWAMGYEKYFHLAPEH